MRSGSEKGSYLRLADVCITQLEAESNTEEEEEEVSGAEFGAPRHDQRPQPRQRPHPPGVGCRVWGLGFRVWG